MSRGDSSEWNAGSIRKTDDSPWKSVRPLSIMKVSQIEIPRHGREEDVEMIWGEKLWITIVACVFLVRLGMLWTSPEYTAGGPWYTVWLGFAALAVGMVGAVEILMMSVRLALREHREEMAKLLRQSQENPPTPPEGD